MKNSQSLSIDKKQYGLFTSFLMKLWLSVALIVGGFAPDTAQAQSTGPLPNGCSEQIQTPALGTPFSSGALATVYPPGFGWTFEDGTAGGVNFFGTPVRFIFIDDPVLGQTLTSNSLERLQFGSEGDAAVIYSEVSWNNGSPLPSARAILSWIVDGTVYAVMTSPNSTTGGNATIVYLNGASGSVTSVPIDTRTTIRIQLPATVSASGPFQFSYDGFADPISGSGNDFGIFTTSVRTCGPVDAVDDTATNVDGAVGATIPSVVSNDTFGGASLAIGADVTINNSGTAQNGTALGLDITPTSGGISLSSTSGEVTVDPGTPAGSYIFTYEICSVLHSTRDCDTATVTVVVGAAPILAVDDAPSAVSGTTGAILPNVVANDTLNGVANPAISTDVTLTVDTSATPNNPGDPVPVLNTVTGEVDVPAGTPGGSYNILYEICEVLNPSNCDTATVTVVVTATDLIVSIEDDLEDILEGDLANTLAIQSDQISGYSADALDRLRGHDTCLASVNARLKQENILFDTDRAVIKPASHRTLDEIAVILSSCAGSAFEIAGHTDSDASDAYNLDLSQRRVEAVLRALTRRGVDTTGYIARGYGESQPIASNATEAGKARNRRVEFRALTNEDGYHGPCEDSFSLVRAFDAQANDDGANVDGNFLRDEHDCITDRREVYEGSLSFSDTNQGQTQTAINLSYRREQYRGSDSVFGYFVGLYASQSDVSRRANGEIRGLGVNAGIYGANRLHEELFLDYYLGAATGRHEFDLAFDRGIGTITATGDYRYVAGFAGAALSGELEVGETTVTPRAGFDYVYTPGADVDVLAQIGALSETGDLDLDATSGGRVFAEIRTDRLIWDDTANFWLNPRISCYQSLGNLDGVCGFGGSFGVESADEDSDLTYTLGLDGEWGSDHFIGSLTLRASRRMNRGLLSGDAGLNADGNVTMGAKFTMNF